MPHSYVSNLTHCTFSTKERLRMIDAELETRLFPYIGGIARENHMKALAIGGTPDHMHALLSLPATMSFAKAVQLIKGGSSKWIHDTFAKHRKFAWQDGYGAFSVSPSQLARTIPTSTTRKSITGKGLSKKNSSSYWTSTASPMTSVMCFANSAVRFTDSRIKTLDDPTDESVGYYHSSVRADSISYSSGLACVQEGVRNKLRTAAQRP